MMQALINILENVLDGTRAIDSAITEAEQFLAETNEKSKYLPVMRTLETLRDKKILDFCGHLRQTMNYFVREFNITTEIYQMIIEYRKLFGFIFTTDHGYQVNIQTEILAAVDDLKSTYSFKKRRENQPSVSDGRLYRFYKYASYTTLSQKLLMYFIANMEKNETLLACLPTGGGKSLSWQLPAISNSYSGLIIVVVPTIALAIDHERSSEDLYNSHFGSGSLPRAYYSGVNAEKKKEIFAGIESGELPILFISPEALQNKEFEQGIIKAAQHNKISALIVDEAHLIVNWGTSFRPEFQLLSTFRNNLKHNCPDGLKTILLSATYTSEDTQIIKTIFKDDLFTEYRADELRPEPDYYYHKCLSEAERIDLVNQLVSQAPKPLIVYTVGPEEGKKYFNAIKELGYKNIAMFTGNTKNDDRQAIIENWNNNKIDIIVATSAFGMGVDKADIRTIITAYIPETISRFYQEVGRAGRDGFSALNYFLPYDEIDKKYVKSLTQGKVITAPLLAQRWKEMLSQAERKTPETVWIDINVPPEHLKFVQTGKRNAGWNKDVILFLFRVGLIEIVAVENVTPGDYKILVRLKNIQVLESSELLVNSIGEFREAERKRITDGIGAVNALMQSEKKGCYSGFLVNEFPYAERLCSGCPYCCKNDLEDFYKAGHIIIKSNKLKLAAKELPVTEALFSKLLSASRTIMLTVPNPSRAGMIQNGIELLIKEGVNIVIAAKIYDEIKLLEVLSYYESYKYMILTLEEALAVDIKWLNGICALFYTNNDEYNQRLYDFAERYENADEENKIIHIAAGEQYIKSQMRPLSDVVDQNLSGKQFFEVVQ